MSSDPDSDDGDGEGGKDITASEQADKSFAGMFSTHLKEKATRSARVSKQSRLQRGRWREKSAEMTYEERQEYFKVKNQQVDEKALMSTQPEREAKMEKKRKNREWSENSKVIEGIFRKPAKLLQKEKKQVAQLLDEKFPRMKPLEKRLISWYLKYCISSISLLSSVHSRPRKEMLDARLV
jgi:hypothetical protein